MKNGRFAHRFLQDLCALLVDRAQPRLRRGAPAAAFICFFAGFLTAQSPKIALEIVAGGFDRPVDIANAGDDRLFIVEQDGIIRIIGADGQALSTPFLNIDARVGSSGNEQGLLGLAFHPDYAGNGFFYVNYTNTNGDTRVSRFRVSGNPNIADPNSEKILLSIDQPYSNHNGGDLAFGPDGYLYIGLGDGGSGGDPQNSGQTATTFLGKMLRIDVDNGNPYAIPPDNPFADEDFFLDEIWAYGLRNPWRFSFDRLTGDLWIGDVGQDAWEEINFQPAGSAGGQNYGWRCYEGNVAYNTSGCQGLATMTPPVAAYSHSGSVGCSVNGGYVYRGQDFPALHGFYFYSDYCSGRFWTLKPNGQGGWVSLEALNGANNTFVSFGEDKDGELYVSALNGTVYRITDICATVNITSEIRNVTCNGAADGAINLTVSTQASSVAYQWSNGAGGEDISGLTPGAYSVSITDSNGCVFERTFQIAEPAAISVVIQADGNQLSVPDLFASYQWFWNGQAVGGATQPVLVAANPGNYTVEVTTDNGCTAVSAPVNFQINSAFETLGISAWTILPNPVGDEVRVRVRTVKKAVFNVRLVDAGGRQYFQERWEVNGSVQKIIPAADLAPGVYWILMEENGKKAVGRFVKG